MIEYEQPLCLIAAAACGKGVDPMRVIISLLLLVSVLSVGLPGALSAAADTAATTVSAEPRVSVDISGHPFKGPADAPVTLVVFSDYL
jgi:protein-disulfide isomerase